MPAVHRDQGQVDVDHQVRLGRAPVERDLLPLRGLADVDVVLRVFAVVLVQAIGMEGAENSLTDYVSQLVLGHAPMQTKRRDDVQVIDAGLRGHVDDLFHHELAHIRGGHRRQWQREVVEGDRQLHPSPQQRLQRVVFERLCQGALDRTLRMPDRIERVRWVHDARAERQPLQPDALAEVEEHRRRVAIDLDHRTRSWHLGPQSSQIKRDLHGA